jgi:hypothetical protein
VELFTVLSKKEQVAKAIKQQISDGRIAPGTKLSSVRTLAENFSVSTRIIVDAFEILEQEKFIRREQGRGVFVRDRALNDSLEVCLTCWGPDLGDNEYFADMTRIAYPPYLQTNFNFTIRMVQMKPETGDSQFALELKKFEQHLNADCILIIAPALNKNKIQACLKLKTPVIFIGDFSSGVYPSMPFNQITGDNFWQGAEEMRQIAEKTAGEDVVILSGSLEHYFYRKCYEGVLDVADKLNIKTHLIEMPRGFSTVLTPEQRHEIFIKTVKAANIKNFLNLPILNHGLAHDFLFERIADGDIGSRIFQSKSGARKEFYNTIYNQIKRVVENPLETKKIRLKADIKVNSI